MVANDARGTRKNKNSCFRVKNRKIILETTKAIKPHKEIYADYGSDYWPRSYYKFFSGNITEVAGKKLLTY